MNETEQYISELRRIVRKLDLAQRYTNELISVSKDITQEFNLEGISYDHLIAELGSPSEFVHKYFENREIVPTRNMETPLKQSKAAHPGSISYYLQKVEKRSTMGGKFAPQYSRYTQVFFVLIAIIASYNIIMRLFVSRNSVFWSYDERVKNSLFIKFV